MAWTARHLFIESRDREALAAALTSLLADPARRANLEGLLDPPGPVQVTPPYEGWIAVTGAGAWLADLPAAAGRLSEALGCRAVSCEMFGNCYRLRLTSWEGGQERSRVQTPEGDWSCEEEPPRMPRYADCEQQAFEALTGHGIPPALVVIGTSPLGVTSERVALEEAALTLTPQPDGDGVERGELELDLPRFEGPDAPVQPNGVSRDFGLCLFEDRYVEGAPDAGSLARLLEIEQRLTERAERACGGAEARVNLTVTYHAGVYQGPLDDLLRAEGHHTQHVTARDRPPWWAFWRYIGKVR